MPEASLAVSLESFDALGDGVRVEFQKHGDRFGHTIFAVREGEAVTLLESIEGTPDKASPPSPPFTELHQQGEILFLSGATTLGHCSMSVQAVDGRLLFDVACRVKKETESLGSTYRTVATNYLFEPGEATQLTLHQEKLLVAPSREKESDFPTTIQWHYTIAIKA